MREAEWVVGTAALGLAYGLGKDGHEPQLMAEESAAALVRRCLESGIERFDTAPAYGVSEKRLGDALGDRGIVWTKVGRGDASDDALADRLQESIATSLERLRRPRLDRVQWHNWTADLGSSAAFRRAWDVVRTDSRVVAAGATTYGATDAVAAIDSGLFASVQVEWNLLNQSVLDAIGERARRANVKVAVRSVLLQGVLSDTASALPAEPELAEGRRRALAYARSMGSTLQDLALRSALFHPYVDFVLVGLERLDEIDALLRIANGPPIEQAEREAMRALDLRGSRAADPRFWRR